MGIRMGEGNELLGSTPGPCQQQGRPQHSGSVTRVGSQSYKGGHTSDASPGLTAPLTQSQGAIALARSMPHPSLSLIVLGLPAPHAALHPPGHLSF